MESHNASIKLPESKDAGEQAPKEEAAYSEVMLASKIEEVRAFRELVFDKNLASPNFFMCVRGRVGYFMMIKKTLINSYLLN